ncbi:UNVERIFIED_CONTAM: Pentatricopeptide repeat-containing protein, mitochondrial [Sesamum calycinum]|uniref:Pentatricopeptide repeat-containing protein, mitochondrial n=1 Tax=Sesamum calycinum TaxID=2727403 RepID=A0AAW2N484_9LAMI
MGLVEEGWEHFKSMRTLFKVEPGPDHYACIVDLLGRAGLLDEVMRLIKSMPVEPHSGVWGALLGASRTHMRLDLAKLAARHILELEPNNAAPYVVLSDIYSFMEKRGDEEQMRLSKNLRGIKKSPGCSWITVRNEMIVFCVYNVEANKFHQWLPSPLYCKHVAGEIKLSLLAVLMESGDSKFPSKLSTSSLGQVGLSKESSQTYKSYSVNFHCQRSNSPISQALLLVYLLAHKVYGANAGVCHHEFRRRKGCWSSSS